MACTIDLKRAVLAVALSAAQFGGPQAIAAEPPAASDGQIAVHVLQQDMRIAEILQDLKAKAGHGRVVFRNVRIVDPISGSITPGQSVIASGPRIVWMGPAASEPKVPGLVVVDGADRYLAPALADMHVHSNGQGDWLLDLAAGVTTVREMAGFPWLLKARDAVGEDRMLAPVSYVAGPLIAALPFHGYAVVVNDASDARRVVRQEAACGYDFVKVHNVLPESSFDAVAEAAKAMDMDLVGHVPHDIAIRHAAERGMRTMEHFKGYVDDRTLALGETDYAAVVDGPEIWNTPTLYTNIGTPQGDAAHARLASPELQYTPLRDRQGWARDLAAGKPGPAKDSARPMFQVLAKLNALHAKFLAGTDSGNNPYSVSGFALLDELKLLQQGGLTPLQTVQAATSEPARAMRVAGAFGQVGKYQRADLVLLDANPLKDAGAYRNSRGVMAHGWWLDRASLDAALARLAAIYAEPDNRTSVDAAAAAALLNQLAALSEAGAVFNTADVQAAAGALRAAGLKPQAERLAALAYDPQSGACAQHRPE